MRLTDHTAHISFSGVPVPKRLPYRRTVKSPGAVTRRDQGSESISPFICWVFEKAKLDPSVYRPACLNRRLNACLRRLRVATPDAGRTMIECRPKLLNAALDTLLLGVSEFLRDPGVFQDLRDLVLPRMLERGGRLRIWSIGVSEGHELYSIAILLAEMGALDRCELIGMDCRPEAIRRAGRGWFTDGDLKGVSDSLRERYFSPEEKGWAVKDGLRQAMEWSVGNVLSLDGAGSSDIIFFRNVALYLTARHADCAWSALYGRLKPHGMLVAGKADKPPASLNLIRVAPCIYQRPGR
ncbi:MAG: CheR family methyltransferase [Limisphaerales bacterium]